MTPPSNSIVRFDARTLVAAASALLLGCSSGGARDMGGGRDGAMKDASIVQDPDLAMAQDMRDPGDMRGGADLSGTSDLASPRDLAMAADMSTPADMSMAVDMSMPADMSMPPDMRSSGPITGGPCAAGVPGATALRVKWYNSGGRATVSYDMHGLPDKSRYKVSVYGRSIGFMPAYVDPFLGPGGVEINGSSFIDIELSTVGVSSLSNVTLSIYGRSYSTGSSGSFNWMTFTGAGSTATNYVSNTTPYKWYPADATLDIDPNDGKILMRVEAGPSSGSLVVNQLELCMTGS